MANHIETLVEGLAEQLLEGTGIELVDVEYIKEREWYLRVFIDKEGGIDIEDCQALSEKIEAKLDELDPIQDSYYLEVSSPGLDRILKKEKDLRRHIGDMVEVTTYMAIDGKKTSVGKLTGFNDEKIELGDLSIARDKIATIRLHLEL